MAASVWSGYLTFGLISMPVRLFSGARSSGISFNMLHRDDLQRVKQQYYCPADNKVVERNEIVKGYEFRKGEYVVIEPVPEAGCRHADEAAFPARRANDIRLIGGVRLIRALA